MNEDRICGVHYWRLFRQRSDLTSEQASRLHLVTSVHLLQFGQ